MYAYYMIAAMGPEYQKYLWWKKYMTWIQLTQFCIMLTYLVFIIMMDCKLHRSLTFFFVGNVVIFLYLFSDFYRKSYIKNKKLNAIKMKVSLTAQQKSSIEVNNCNNVLMGLEDVQQQNLIKQE